MAMTSEAAVITETGAASGAIFLSAYLHIDAAQGAVVHIHGTRPGDAFGIEL